MKIRTDYVSNSSSSSFMIVGESFTNDDLIKMAELHKLKPDYPEQDTDYGDWGTYEIVEGLEERFPELTFRSGIDNYYDEHCIGMQYDDMKPKETKQAFENRIKEQLKDLSGRDCVVKCLVDGGMDN